MPSELYKILMIQEDLEKLKRSDLKQQAQLVQLFANLQLIKEKLAKNRKPGMLRDELSLPNWRQMMPLWGFLKMSEILNLRLCNRQFKEIIDKYITYLLDHDKAQIELLYKRIAQLRDDIPQLDLETLERRRQKNTSFINHHLQQYRSRDRIEMFNRALLLNEVCAIRNLSLHLLNGDDQKLLPKYLTHMDLSYLTPKEIHDKQDYYRTQIRRIQQDVQQGTPAQLNQRTSGYKFLKRWYKINGSPHARILLELIESIEAVKQYEQRVQTISSHMFK